MAPHTLVLASNMGIRGHRKPKKKRTRFVKGVGGSSRSCSSMSSKVPFRSLVKEALEANSPVHTLVKLVDKTTKPSRVMLPEIYLCDGCSKPFFKSEIGWWTRVVKLPPSGVAIYAWKKGWYLAGCKTCIRKRYGKREAVDGEAA